MKAGALPWAGTANRCDGSNGQVYEDLWRRRNVLSKSTRVRRLVVGAAAIAGASLLAACGAVSAGAQLSRQGQTGSGSGGVVTFANQVGAPPTYIFPMYPIQDAQNSDITYFQPLLWRPLYWFGHESSSAPTINYRLSLAYPPEFSNGGRTVTVRLRRYVWSDGRPVTSRDVEFWMHLLLAVKSSWGIWAPGDWSSHIVGMNFARPGQFSITFNQQFNQNYLLYNGLAQITPIPQHAWDRKAAGGAIGNYDRTAAGARAVYSYLNDQSKTLATWDTNPLWQVVDGPWRLQPNTGFNPATGYAAFVPNRHYSGPQRPKVSKYELLTFTSATAEFDALLAGRVDYGYLPFQDVALKQRLLSSGYQVKPWLYWGISYIPFNFANPRVGRVFDQLYIRQAMQHVIDESQYISRVFKGYGSPDYGPVPVQPPSQFVSPLAAHPLYPYSVGAARQLLASHGWVLHGANSAASCERPGSGPSECGAGIARGAALNFTMLYASGTPAYSQIMQAWKSSLAEAGIQLALSQAPFSTVAATEAGCDAKTGSGCSWEMTYLGAPTTTYVPVYYPTGEIILHSGAPDNVGNYDNPVNDANINASHVQPGLGALYRYEDFVARQLPLLYMPNSVYQISVISKRLHGVTAQDSTNHIYPEVWTLSKR